MRRKKRKRKEKRICRLCRRFPTDEAAIEKEIRLAGAAVLVFALVPEHVTGKRVHEA